MGAKVIRIPVELRIGSNPTSDMPPPPVDNIKTAADRVRPGLSEQEMLNLVSRPMNIVDPRSVAQPDLSSRPAVYAQIKDGNNATSGNWSGAVILPIAL